MRLSHCLYNLPFSTRQKDIVTIKDTMDSIKDMYPEVLSLGLRSTNGKVLAQ